MRRFPTTLKHGFGIALLTISLGTIALAQDRPEVFARGGAADNEAAPTQAANNTPVQAAADTDLVTSGPAGQADITVYGSVFAQVQETRNVTLKAGRNRVQLNGVAARYRTDSLRVVDAKGPGTFTYRSATYQPANLTNDKLLLESVGKEVKAWRYTSKGQAEIRGTLKSVAGTALTISLADGSTELVNTADVTLLQTPQGLSNTASLVVEVDATADGDYQVDFLYETDGITWSAKHSLIFDEEKSTVQSWEATVSLVNESGTSFQNATVRLLSGRVTQGDDYFAPANGGLRVYAASDAMRSPEAASVENVGDQKLYTIPGTVNLAAGQTRQVPLFNGKNVPVKRTYVVGTASPRAHYSADGKQDAQIRLTVDNCAKHNLGSPLPGGLVKVYQYNASKKLQLTGSTRVSDKATDEVFDLNIGTSSDIKWDVKLVDSVVVKYAQKADPAGDGASVGGEGPDIGGNGAIGPRRATTPGRAYVNPQDGTRQEFSDRTYEVTVYNYKKDRSVEVKVEVVVSPDQNLEPKWLRPRRDRAETKLTVPQSDKASIRYILREQTR